MSATTTKPVKARARTKVIHYYMKRQARLAETVGLPVPYLCGRVAPKTTNARTERTVPVVGRLMVASESRDCRQCVRAYEATLRGWQDRGELLDD